CCFFFFQAEDGIRDYKVTGVQTCALPISVPEREIRHREGRRTDGRGARPGRRGRPRHAAPGGQGRCMIRINLAPVRERKAFRISDRKSTRLNSSHLVISYAVFCLKKKNHY